jgi:hypothetical protein
VIRFFESSAADFKMENQIFEVCSKKGLSPKFIESDGESYRIEEFFEGKGFTNKLLQETSVI